MKILGIEGITADQLRFEVERGAKFVLFQYCFSVLIMTFKRSSDIYFIRAGESKLSKILGFSIISFLFGWWGIPWGPIYTVGTIATNLGGGKEVTQEVLASLGI